MNIILKGSTPTILGRGYLSSDHLSTATGLDPAITISKNGGNFANPAAGASVMTEIESTGWYKFSLGAGDTDTEGHLIIRGTHATMDNIEVVYQVVNDKRGLSGTALPAAAADAAGGLPISDAGGLDIDAIKTMTDKIGTVTNTGGTATIGAILGDFANSALVTRVADIHSDIAALTIPTAAAIADAVWDEAIADHSGAGKTAQAVSDILTDTGTTLDGKIDLIEDVVRNKMRVTDADGEVTLYADDNSTPLFTVANCVTDNSTYTTRKRLE